MLQCLEDALLLKEHTSYISNLLSSKIILRAPQDALTRSKMMFQSFQDDTNLKLYTPYISKLVSPKNVVRVSQDCFKSFQNDDLVFLRWNQLEITYIIYLERESSKIILRASQDALNHSKMMIQSFQDDVNLKLYICYIETYEFKNHSQSLVGRFKSLQNDDLVFLRWNQLQITYIRYVERESSKIILRASQDRLNRSKIMIWSFQDDFNLKLYTSYISKPVSSKIIVVAFQDVLNYFKC